MSTSPTEPEAPVEPQWRSRVVERSMRAMLEKTVDRSDRFIAAAYELLGEVGSDFSVQDVVDRSKTSLRSFYQSFGGKDDLFLAIYEEAMISGLESINAAVDAAGPDPVLKLKAFLQAEWAELQKSNDAIRRALAIYHQRLAETRPAELAAVLAPQHDLLVGLVAGCRAAGKMHSGQSDEMVATFLLHLLVITLQSSVLDVRIGSLLLDASDLWDFVANMFDLTAP